MFLLHQGLIETIETIETIKTIKTIKTIEIIKTTGGRSPIPCSTRRWAPRVPGSRRGAFRG